MTEKIRALVKGGTLSEQLIAVRKRIAVIDAETVRTDGELERLALPALRGDGEAVAATGELEQRKQTLAAEREALRRAEGQLHSGVTAEAAAATQAALEAWPAELAEMRARHIELGQHAEDQLVKLRSTIAVYIASGKALAEKSKNPVIRRFMETAYARLRGVIARHFVIDPSRNDGTPASNLLGVVSPFVKPQSEWSLAQFDTVAFDDAVPLFRSEAAARAAQDRLATAGTKTVLHQIGAVWEVVRADDLYTDRVAAERAAAATSRIGRTQVVRSHGRGCRVMEKAVAEAADAIAAAAQPPAA